MIRDAVWLRGPPAERAARLRSARSARRVPQGAASASGVRAQTSAAEHAVALYAAQALKGSYVPAAGTALAQFEHVSDALFSLTWNTSVLDGGKHYRLCVDLDGDEAALGFGDAGIDVYATPASESLTRAVLPEDGQQVTVRCSAGCTAGTLGHLVDTLASGGCNDTAATDPAALRERLAARSELRSSVWDFDVDARGLLEGFHYIVCLDLDGAEDSDRAGDTGLAVYVSPVSHAAVTATGDRVVRPAPGQQLSLTCAGCSSSTEAVLMDTCADGHAAASAAAASLGGRVVAAGHGTWSVDVDGLSGAQVGRHLRLCSDLDGAHGPLRTGDTGLDFYVSGTDVLRTPSVGRGAAEVVSLDCGEGCSAASTAYLSTSCDRTALDGAMLIENSTQTLSSNFAPNSSGWWTITLNTSNVTAGQTLTLCTDLDGSETALGFGDSSLRVFVSDVAAVAMPATWEEASKRLTLASGLPLAVPRQSGLLLALRCAAPGSCSVASQAFLGADCSASASLPDGVRANFFGLRSRGEQLQMVRANEGPADGGTGRQWTDYVVDLDASGLLEGRHYWLCFDADGDGEESTPGNTGFRFHVTALEAAASPSIQERRPGRPCRWSARGTGGGGPMRGPGRGASPPWARGWWRRSPPGRQPGGGANRARDCHGVREQHPDWRCR
ncbi:unnamed protein product, partial [Prorocentrum cordatum]